MKGEGTKIICVPWASDPVNRVLDICINPEIYEINLVDSEKHRFIIVFIRIQNATHFYSVMFVGLLFYNVKVSSKLNQQRKDLW